MNMGETGKWERGRAARQSNQRERWEGCLEVATDCFVIVLTGGSGIVMGGSVASKGSMC